MENQAIVVMICPVRNVLRRKLRKSGWGDLAIAATLGVGSGLKVANLAVKTIRLASKPTWVNGTKAINAAARKAIKVQHGRLIARS
jgi:hypothetical protein